MNKNELEKTAKFIRRSIVDMIYKAKSSHIGCSLSVTDILTALYFSVLNIDPNNPSDPNRDRLVLSKGHAVAALYVTLAKRGFFPISKLEEYGTDGTKLACHIVKDAVPGVETSAGSGGHGLSLGIGMALAIKIKKGSARVFVISGDAETEEGSVWEALMFAGHHNISNLKLIIDRNNFQDGMDGLRVDEILNLNPLDEKLKAFGWEVDIVNGHDFDELVPALNKKTERPHAIIAKTTKGKGVSFMENKGEWHGKCPSDEQYAIAVKELS